ncbi:MAG: small, acid-soluble spore protein, alpha/beta type [Bacilli bacterium]
MKKKNNKKSKTYRSNTNVDKMKYEIANEFGVDTEVDCEAKSNGVNTKNSINCNKFTNSNSKKTNRKSN